MKISTISVILFILSLSVFLSCQSDSKAILIKGDLKKLPDGTMHLINVYPWKILDSTTVRNGQFSFVLNKEKYPEPTLVKIIHYNNKKEPKILIYPTNQIFSGKPLGMDVFLLENGVDFTGDMDSFDWTYKLKNPIITGPQTKVMYNDSIGFSRIKKISEIKNAIKKPPYSFYYLFELKKRVQSFTNVQFLDILKCFDEDVQNSQTALDLKDYILGRHSQKLNELTTALDEYGHQQKIINPKASLNMIILWASWCGPCRKEIPNLKLLHQRYNPNLHMVSISVDEDSLNWHKALKQEKMPWKQLLLRGNHQKYVKEVFEFDGSIPLILIVNTKGKIIKKIIGYDKKHSQEIFTIVENLSKNQKLIL